MRETKILRIEEVDMTLAPDDLRQLLDELGLSQLEAARRLGVTGRAVQHWVAGTYGVPGPAERLLRTWLRHPELMEEGTDE